MKTQTMHRSFGGMALALITSPVVAIVILAAGSYGVKEVLRLVFA